MRARKAERSTHLLVVIVPSAVLKHNGVKECLRIRDRSCPLALLDRKGKHISRIARPSC